MQRMNENLKHFTPQLIALLTDSSRDSFRANAYLCPSSRLTIGYGHVLLPRDAQLFAGVTAKSLAALIATCTKLRRITPEAKSVLWLDPKTAFKLLESDCRMNAEYLLSVIHVPLNQNQFDALMDFVFNVGQANFATSTLRAKLNAGYYKSAAQEFDRWTYGTVNDVKTKLPGLIARRAAERELFERPI